MREDFTNTLRHVMDTAQQEARKHRQEYVSTEALFLGVISCHECEAERILRQAKLNPETLRMFVSRSMPTAKEEPVVIGDLPLTPKAQRMIQGAIVKAQALREPKISTRHLLLSLLDDPQTAIREALSTAMGDVNVLRHALVDSPEDEEE